MNRKLETAIATDVSLIVPHMDHPRPDTQRVDLNIDMLFKAAVMASLRFRVTVVLGLEHTPASLAGNASDITPGRQV